MGKGGCTAAGRAARSKAQGQPDLSEGCVRRDDAYKVPQAHFYVEIADRAPPHRGRGQGVRSRAPPVADAARRSTRSGRKNRASEQREDFFGHRKAVGADTPWLPLERICAQYGYGFFSPEKSISVASTDKRQRGLQRGKPGSPLPCFASFCRSKRKAPAASGAN